MRAVKGGEKTLFGGGKWREGGGFCVVSRQRMKSGNRDDREKNSEGKECETSERGGKSE